LKVSYGKKCAPVSLSTYAALRRWADVARDRRRHAATGESSLRPAGDARRRHVNETTLIGRDIDVDGVTSSRMTSKPTTQTESAVHAAFMAALCNRGAIIFLLRDFYLSIFFFFYSSLSKNYRWRIQGISFCSDELPPPSRLSSLYKTAIYNAKLTTILFCFTSEYNILYM